MIFATYYPMRLIFHIIFSQGDLLAIDLNQIYGT